MEQKPYFQAHRVICLPRPGKCDTKHPIKKVLPTVLHAMHEAIETTGQLVMALA